MDFSWIKSVTKIAFLLVIVTTCAGFFMRIIQAEVFMSLVTLMAGSYYGMSKRAQAEQAGPPTPSPTPVSKAPSEGGYIRPHHMGLLLIAALMALTLIGMSGCATVKDKPNATAVNTIKTARFTAEQAATFVKSECEYGTYLSPQECELAKESYTMYTQADKAFTAALRAYQLIRQNKDATPEEVEAARLRVEQAKAELATAGKYIIDLAEKMWTIINSNKQGAFIIRKGVLAWNM